MSKRADDGARTSVPEQRSRDDAPVLPELTRDEQDLGWGDEPSRRDLEWYRTERPPHYE